MRFVITELHGPAACNVVLAPHTHTPAQKLRLGPVSFQNTSVRCEICRRRRALPLAAHLESGQGLPEHVVQMLDRWKPFDSNIAAVLLAFSAFKNIATSPPSTNGCSRGKTTRQDAAVGADGGWSPATQPSAQSGVQNRSLATKAGRASHISPATVGPWPRPPARKPRPILIDLYHR